VKQYQNLFRLFSSHLEEYKLSLANKQPRELYEPENYILSLGGKRLRPLMALVACDIFDADPKLALNSALSVELFHNFSLMHDDILDAAPLRRNKETVHTKWNTNIAILSGDVMLTKAFRVLENYPAEIFKQLSVLFSQTAIYVCEGQQLDMNFERNNNVTVDEYINMITGKTAVLLGCSLKMGAINAAAGKQEQENIYEFGKHLGIAFQLLDDLLDAYADDAGNFGKQNGRDIISNKKTFLLLKAFELANTHQQKELNRLLELKENKSEEKIAGVKNIFDSLEIKKICFAKADEHTQLAIGYLSKLNANESKKEQLKQFGLELLKRQA